MEITGKSRIMFVLADPVDHVRASAVLNAYFSSIGEDVATVPLHVHPDDLATVATAIRRMDNVVGFGVTIPHKVAILPLLDEATPMARTIGAVNFVKRTPDGRLIGDNFDAPGFIASLVEHRVSIAGIRVLQLGAGGAGRATALALAKAGVGKLLISNRDEDKARRLAEEIAVTYPDIDVAFGHASAETFDLIVNTTPLGMKPNDDLPIDLDRISPSTVVYDIIVNPPITSLMRLAQQCGARAIGGQAMLDAQMSLVSTFVTR